MIFKRQIAPELEQHWHAVIDRHFAMTVAPLEASLERAHVHFMAQDDGGTVRYCCELSGTTAAGASFSCRALQRDGRTAITDAFARARREILRRQRTAFIHPHQKDANGQSP